MYIAGWCTAAIASVAFIFLVMQISLSAIDWLAGIISYIF